MKKSIQFPVWFIDTSMIYAVTSTILAEKRFKVKSIIYVEIIMIYTVSSMIYRYQYDLQSPVWFIDTSMIYSHQYDFNRKKI